MLDTESIYTKMLQIIASRYDRTFTWDVKVKMMGKKHQDSAQVFIGKPICVFLYFVIFVTHYCHYFGLFFTSLADCFRGTFKQKNLLKCLWICRSHVRNTLTLVYSVCMCLLYIQCILIVDWILTWWCYCCEFLRSADRFHDFDFLLHLYLWGYKFIIKVS